MAIFASVPTSQKADVRPISFLLSDGGGGGMQSVALVVRPEDLTRVEPSRMSIQQTLDPEMPSWVDSFGPGLPTVNISGHTGWRDINGSGDGIAQFEKLNQIAFKDWHALRMKAINAGRDPDQVRLIFSDALDNFTYVVAPQSFTLRRSRSRPLLMQYQISMQAVSTSVDPAPGGGFGLFGDILADLGLESLGDVLGKIDAMATDVAGLINGSVGVLAKDFLNMSSKVLGVTMRVVGSLKGSIDKVTGAFLGVARDIMRSGRNLFTAVSAVMALPSYAKFRMMQVASAFNTGFCILKNIFKARRTFPKYNDWYGASSCSSTAGGSPLSPLRDINPFYLLNKTTGSPFQVSQAASTAIQNAVGMDAVRTPPVLSETSNMLRLISGGVAVNEAFA